MLKQWRLAFGLALSATLWAAVPAYALFGDSSPGALIAEGRQFVAKGDLKEAQVQFKKAIKANPEDGEARFELGNVQMRLGDFAGAEAQLEMARDRGYAPEKTVPLIAWSMLYQGRNEELLKSVQPCPDNAVCRAEVLSARAQAELALRDIKAADADSQAAVESQPDGLPGLRARARVLAAKGDYAKAEETADRILGLNPKLADVSTLKGDLRRQAGDNAAAAKFYGNALEISPKDLTARTRLASVLMAQGQTDAARREIDQALVLQPKSVMALYLKGLLLAKTDKMAEALQVVRPVEAELGKDPRGAFLLAVIHLANNNIETAYKFATQFHAQAPGDLPGTKLLAQASLRMRDFDKVVRLLEPLREQLAGDPAALDILGSAYLAEGKVKDANEALTQAVSLRPEATETRERLALLHTGQKDTRDAGIHELEELVSKNPERSQVSIALIGTYFRSGNYDGAIELATALSQREPNNPLPLSLRGLAKQGKGDEVGARSDFNAALTKDETYVPAVLDLSDLDLRAGKFDSARQDLDKILKTKPDELPALMMRAKVEVAANNVAACLPFPDRAIAAHPSELEPRAILLKILASGTDPVRAAGVAQDLAQAQAKNPKAIGVAVEALLVLGKTDDAIAVMKKAEGDFAADARVNEGIGKVFMQLGRWSEAKEALDRAISVDPALIPAWADRVVVEFKVQGLDAALALAAKAQQVNPKSQMAQLLSADLLLRTGHFPEAEQAYGKVLAANPGPVVMNRVFDSIIAGGDRPRARKALTEWLAAHPDDLAGQMALAGDFLAAKEYRTAAQRYESLAAKMPRNAVVFNNLANVYDNLGDPRAVETARVAYGLSPETSSIADTYGWLLFRKGDREQGGPLIRSAQQSDPGNPVKAYHLAEVLSARNEPGDAKRILKQLIEAKVNFEDIDAARKLYARLGGQ